jgi:hypothetical protein
LFVFNGRLAGINTCVPWDGGAATSFVDSHLVAQYGLHIQKQPQEVHMANGMTVLSPGIVMGNLAIQKISGTATLRVLLLAPCFGVVLGDDWDRRHCLLLDYGSAGTEKTPSVQPSLLLRSEHLRLMPTPAISKPKSETDKSEVTNLECCLITAQQAKRILRQPRQGSRHPLSGVNHRSF